MGVKITGEFTGGLEMRMRHEHSGAVIATDPPLDNGGRGASFSPTDMLAASYGACMMSIVALLGKKESIDLRGMQVAIEKHMTSSMPRRIGSLDVNLMLPAHLSPTQREQLVTAAKNCPVALSVSSDISVNFNVSYR